MREQEAVMSEFESEVGAPPTQGPPEPAADAGDVGGWPVEPSWSPSPEEWQQTQETLGAIVQQLAPEEPAPQGLDVWADDFPEQLDAYVGERLRPVDEFLQRAQAEAALASGHEDVSKIVAGHAEQLGAELDEATVRTAAQDEIVREASAVLAREGFAPEQVRQVLGLTPDAAAQVVAAAYGRAPDDVARAALEVAAAGLHHEATRQRGPYGVLSRYTQQQGRVPQTTTKGGPYAVLQKYRAAGGGRR
jgi:hypothetical protein